MKKTTRALIAAAFAASLMGSSMQAKEFYPTAADKTDSKISAGATLERQAPPAKAEVSVVKTTESLAKMDAIGLQTQEKKGSVKYLVVAMEKGKKTDALLTAAIMSTKASIFLTSAKTSWYTAMTEHPSPGAIFASKATFDPAGEHFMAAASSVTWAGDRTLMS